MHPHPNLEPQPYPYPYPYPCPYPYPGALAALRLADMLRPALLECWEVGHG